MTASRVRKKLRKARQERNRGKLTPEQKAKADQAKAYVTFGKRPFDEFEQKEPGLSKREARTVRSKDKADIEMHEAMKAMNNQRKAPYVKQPGQVKANRSREVETILKDLAQSKRDRKAGRISA